MQSEVTVEPAAPVSTLAAWEAVVERGLVSFLDSGRALSVIRNHRLYLETHPTWERYCADRWGFTDRRARQLIAAAEVVDRLQQGSEVGNVLPVTESGSVYLGRLPEGLRRLAWAALLKEPGAAGAEEVAKLAGDILAGMSPDEQAAIMGGGGEGVAAVTRATAAVPRILSAPEKWQARIEHDYPGAVESVGRDRVNAAFTTLAALAAAVRGSG